MTFRITRTLIPLGAMKPPRLPFSDGLSGLSLALICRTAQAWVSGTWIPWPALEVT